MLPLKRLLNEDDGSGIRSDASLHREFQSLHTDNEVPTFLDQSLPGIWGGLLNPDLSNEDGIFDWDDLSDALPISSEDAIQTWAEECQPLEDLSLNANTVLETEETSPAEAVANVVCYGMIYRTGVKVIGSMLEIERRLKNSNESRKDYQLFSVKRRKDILTLIFADGTDFGILNTHTATALCKVLDKYTVELECIAPVLSVRETIEKASKANEAVVRVDINIYGDIGVKDEAGDCLSNYQLFLQRPNQIRDEVEYDNPHILQFPDLQLESVECVPEYPHEKEATSMSAETFQRTINAVYASLKRNDKLERMEVGNLIRTQLLPHQEQALSYMIQREQGPIPAEYCLWKAAQDDNTEGWYRHAVTGARTRIQHSETGGGILADEMGMGKSLSILSLLVKSLKHAADWVDDENPKSSAEKTHEPRSRATLVIAPSAVLINQWLDEIKIHLDGALEAINYHGVGRKEFAPNLTNVDVVLTTYHTLIADHADQKSPLQHIEWYRVVLDEAHIIRRSATTFYRAVSDLKARYRWCLTGTPIQNRLEDIGALFAFIRARPFDSLAVFRRFVAIPFEESEERRGVSVQNLTLLLESLCLRRSRSLLDLPESQTRARIVTLSPDERAQYDKTKDMMNRALRQRVGEEFTKSKFGMFQIQLQLRILCNHGTYQPEFSWARRSLLDEREDALCSIGDRSEVRCSACPLSIYMLGSNNMYKSYKASCMHILCFECLDDRTQPQQEEPSTCPLCAMSGGPGLKSSTSNAKGLHDNYLREMGHSSKMEALIEDVRRDIDSTKSVIFSCWTNTLNLIERYLRKSSIPFERIDGESPLRRRQKILDDFSNSPKIPVLIMTTGTGAFGLNLTSANRVFIVEPQWNPSVENQAIARAIRFKQREHVIVTRYRVKDTVEQEMESQQQRKRMIASLGNAS